MLANCASATQAHPALAYLTNQHLSGDAPAVFACAYSKVTLGDAG